MEESKELVRLLQETPILALLDQKAVKDTVEIESNTTIHEAIQIMAENRLISVPVYDRMDGMYLGFLDYLDIINLAVKLITKGKDIKENEWGAHFTDFRVMAHTGAAFGKKRAKDVVDASNRDKFVPVYGQGTIFQLIEVFSQSDIHRVPVWNEDKKIIGIVSQSDVVSFLRNHMDILGKLSNKRVGELEIGSKFAISVSMNSPAIHAFYLMDKHKVGAVAVINPNNQTLVANLSASDIRGLSDNHFNSLLLPIHQFLVSAKAVVTPPITCTNNSDFQSLVIKIVFFRIHRLWNVDQWDKPIGVITLTDIMKKIASFQKLPVQ